MLDKNRKKTLEDLGGEEGPQEAIRYSWRRQKDLGSRRRILGPKLGGDGRILEDGGSMILDEHERRKIPRAPSYQEPHFPSLVAA